MKPLIDKILNLAISKKLTVFIIATFFAVFKIISGSEWITISIVYIFVQGSIDFIDYIKNKK